MFLRSSLKKVTRRHYQQRNLHNKGFVRLVDIMPNKPFCAKLKCDEAIVQAARVSYGTGTKQITDDIQLIRYLMRHNHTSPFEMVEFKFHIKLPIFIARQWLRHRTANVNEISYRYSVVEDDFYIPERIVNQSSDNKQCSSDQEILSNELKSEFINGCKSKDQYESYKKYLDGNVSREQARIILPLNTYTQFYWKIDLHNLFRFLELRLHQHAQKEIRDYAGLMYEIVKEHCPVSSKAFEDYKLNSIMLSGLDIDRIKGTEHAMSKREIKEFNIKALRLGISTNKRNSISE